MRSKNVLMLMAVAAPGLIWAQDNSKFQCSFGDLQRRVEIYTEPGVAVPCEVHYFKDTEAPGESEVLWSATNDATYCQAKTEEFVAKLESWGWDCGQGAVSPESMPAPDAAPDPEPMPDTGVQDDTDVLSPGEPTGP